MEKVSYETFAKNAILLGSYTIIETYFWIINNSFTPEAYVLDLCFQKSLIKSTNLWWYAEKLYISELLLFPFLLFFWGENQVNNVWHLGKLGIFWISIEHSEPQVEEWLQRYPNAADVPACPQGLWRLLPGRKTRNRTEQLYNRTTQPPAQVAALHLPQRVAVNKIMWYAAESAAASYLMLINSS